MDPFSSTVMLPHAISANLEKRSMRERCVSFIVSENAAVFTVKANAAVQDVHASMLATTGSEPGDVDTLTTPDRNWNRNLHIKITALERGGRLFVFDWIWWGSLQMSPSAAAEVNSCRDGRTAAACLSDYDAWEIWGATVSVHCKYVNGSIMCFVLLHTAACDVVYLRSARLLLTTKRSAFVLLSWLGLNSVTSMNKNYFPSCSGTKNPWRIPEESQRSSRTEWSPKHLCKMTRCWLLLPFLFFFLSLSFFFH